MGGGAKVGPLGRRAIDKDVRTRSIDAATHQQPLELEPAGVAVRDDVAHLACGERVDPRAP